MGASVVGSACYAVNVSAAGYAVLDHASWFVADVLRFLVLRADWIMLAPYLCRGTCLVQHFLRFTTCF